MEPTPPKLRVAHIITQLELGGAQRNTLYTLEHLNAEGYEPILICGPGGILDEEAEQGKWAMYAIPTLARPVNPVKDLIALIVIYKLLRRLKPQIVHTHSSKAGILGRIAAYFAGVPVIIHTFHGFGFTPMQRPLVFEFFVRVEKFCAYLSTHLIFVSEANRMEATEKGIGTTIPNSLIRSGINVKYPPSSTIREELGIPRGAFIVTSVGNFKPQKNPMDLARTAALVLQKKPDVHFLFLGDGELRPLVEAWVKEQNIQDRVHFPGWRKDAYAIVGASDCFLLTSLWEGLPRALVEAGAARKPSVAYAVDGVRDILRDGVNGFLIPPGNAELAAEKLLWLSGHPIEAIEMCRQARARVEKEFDIDLMVRQQEELYAKLWDAVPLKDYYLPLWIPEEIPPDAPHA